MALVAGPGIEQDTMSDVLKILYEFKEDLSDPGIFFCLCGPVSQNLVAEIGTTLEKKLTLEDAGKSTFIRVFSVVVENVQNIIHYSAEKLPGKDGGQLSMGIIIVGYENGHYFVLSGNLVKNGNVPQLKERLAALRGMTRSELKKYYRKKLKEGPHEGSKGAGVGFIEMAKKADAPLEFDFRKIDDRFSFFSLKIIIASKRSRVYGEFDT